MCRSLLRLRGFFVCVLEGFVVVFLLVCLGGRVLIVGCIFCRRVWLCRLILSWIGLLLLLRLERLVLR